MTSPHDAADTDPGLLSPSLAGSTAREATGDQAYLRAMLDAEAALTRAQAELGLAPAAAARAVTEAADPARFDVRLLAEQSHGDGNPVIPLVKELTRAVGEPYGSYVHRGATSQDILDTATMLVAVRCLGPVLDDLGRAEAALSRLAAAHRDTAMPGRTLTQHAVPTTFGLKAAGWRSLVLDARDRVAAAVGTLPAQLGGAAGTLAAFGAYGAEDTGELVAAYARQAGLRSPSLPWHTLRTPIADLAGCLAFTVGALGKMAADVLTLSRTEIGELAEGVGGGSSAMPHKANPVRSTLIAAAAQRAPQLAATLYGSLAAEDERPAGAWHAEWEPLRDLLRVSAGAAHDAAHLCERLRVHPDAMRRNLGLTHGLIVSERLSAELAPVLGRSGARTLLTRLAEQAFAEDADLRDLLAREAGLQDIDLDGLTDPARYTGSAGVLTDCALERK
ncbi:3-carboxy-cis,cis-muconate cycloisomerase [Streptomyces sp. DW26H14]|uniref:3-carboxy-cis,cis-muconate cycloisomerase n=1 Tax=Streptomyces sp. DW26H14 TaxID=3435395 RepID=UPI00403E1D32